MRMIKYVAVALGAALWIVGLTDQFHSVETTTTYLVLTGAMVAVAVIA